MFKKTALFLHEGFADVTIAVEYAQIVTWNALVTTAFKVVIRFNQWLYQHMQCKLIMSADDILRKDVTKIIMVMMMRLFAVLAEQVTQR